MVLVDVAVPQRRTAGTGVFLWDHIVYRPPVRAVADLWVALSVIAAHTDRVRLGPTVTPLSRRRVAAEYLRGRGFRRIGCVPRRRLPVGSGPRPSVTRPLARGASWVSASGDRDSLYRGRSDLAPAQTAGQRPLALDR